MVIMVPLFVTAGGFRVYTVTDQSILLTGNSTLWSFEARATINPDSGIPYMDGKNKINVIFKKGDYLM